ncbi:uncharacterized protein LOC125062200 [Pieris napi]|uniref:uncharacterized protein LOC125062200 n=1 Tax=Pieris napi TaxID=78633 RepID=UPI001FBA013E|nr:uncharacterized protein LOC125062200 [Pieris napi]
MRQTIRLQVLLVNVLLLKTIMSLEIERFVIEDRSDPADQLNFKRILDIISRSRETPQTYRRMEERAEKIKFLYNFLRTKLGTSRIKKILRNQGETASVPKMDLEGLIENELKNALALKSSALNDRPVLQKRGRNDFLVMKPDVVDPFVTVVPNNIYYNIEKKCVNWLDDCNLQGIRSRLLQKVKSPFK